MKKNTTCVIVFCIDFVILPVFNHLTVAGFSAPVVTRGWQAHAERLMTWAGRFSNCLFDVSSLKAADLLTH